MIALSHGTQPIGPARVPAIHCAILGAIVACATPAALAQPVAPVAPQPWQTGVPAVGPTASGEFVVPRSGATTFGGSVQDAPPGAGLEFARGPATPDARWTTPAAPKKYTDPIMTTAWTELAVGGAFTLAGAISVGVATSEHRVCAEITGCFTAREPSLDPLRFGAFSLGFGAGVFTSAGVTLIVAGLRPLRPEESRQNGLVGSLGHAALSLSVGFFAAGFAYGGVADDGGRDEFGYGWPAFVAGGLLMSAGIPMVVAGAQITDADERGRERAVGQHASVGPMDLRDLELRVGLGSAVAAWSWL